MNLAGNGKELVTLNVGFSEGTYDPQTDTQTPTAGEAIAVEVLPFRRKNTQGGVGLQYDAQGLSKTTETLLVQVADLPDGTQVDEEDTVTRDNGVWSIVGVETPPGGAILLLDIRH